MTKNLWPTRADIRGGAITGLYDKAVLTTLTHSQWDTSGLGGGDSLGVAVDGVGPVAITLPAASYSIEELVSRINTVWGSNIAFIAYGGRLQLRSPTEGIGSSVNVSTSTAPVLALLRFDYTSKTGRCIQSAPEALGTEDNPAGTMVVSSGEPDIQEVYNRPIMFMATQLDQIQGHMVADVAEPTTYKPNAANTKTMDDLGAPQYLLVDSAIAFATPGCVILGAVSGHTANVLNIIPTDFLGASNIYIITNASGDFNVGGEDLSTGGNPAGHAARTQLKDDRIRAVAIPDDVFVGCRDWFGGVTPTADQLESLFALTIFNYVSGASVDRRDSAVYNGSTYSDQVFNGFHPPDYTAHVPYQTGNRCRVSKICAGEPDNAYTPTTYNYQGIIRQAATNISTWTKNRITPVGGLLSTVQPGDIAVVTGSPVGPGTTRNNGNYAIRLANSADGYLEIGPSRSAASGFSLPEDTVADPELFENAPVGGPAQVTVRSPSYLLANRNDSTGTNRKCWLFLEEPAYAQDPITIAYFRITNRVTERPGLPLWDNPWSRHLRSRIEDIEKGLQSLSYGSIEQGVLAKEHWRRTNSFVGLVDIQSGGYHDTLLPDFDISRSFLGSARQFLLNYNESSYGTYTPIDPSLRGPLTTGQLVDHDTSFGMMNTGPIAKMFQREVDACIQMFDYDHLAGGGLTIGAAYTGSVSGAVLRCYSNIYFGADTFLAVVESGYPEPGENFEDGGGNGAHQVTASFVGFAGFHFRLPYATDANHRATTVADSSTVTWTTSVGLTHIENVKPGDVFRPTTGTLAAVNFAARILEVDVAGHNLTLDTPAPWAAAAFQWRVTPDIGDFITLQETGAGGRGATATARNPYIVLLHDPARIETLDNYGVAPGDQIWADTITNSQWLTIQEILVGTNVSLVRVEENYNVIAGVDKDWKIRSRHHRTKVETASITGIKSYGSWDYYDRPLGAEWWWIHGPAYIWIPLVSYADPNPGGVRLSGLMGKTITFDLCRGGEKIDSISISASANWTSVAALVTDLNNALTGAGCVWLTVERSTYPYALVFRTTDYNATGDEYPFVGPDISINPHGEGWEYLIYGNNQVEIGNVSQRLRPWAYAEEACHVFAGSWKFNWVGLVYQIQPLVEMGGDDWDKNVSDGVATIHSRDQYLRLDGWTQAGIPPFLPGEDGDQATLKLEAPDRYPYQGERKTALEVVSGNETRVRVSHGGDLATYRNSVMVRDAEGASRTDNDGQYGQKLDALYSGPVHMDGPTVTWAGYSLAFIVTVVDYSYHPVVLFSAAAITLSSIISEIDAGIKLWVPWLECVKDTAGTGFVVRINDLLVPGGNVPYYHNMTTISVDAKKSSVMNLYGADYRFVKLFPSGRYWMDKTWGGLQHPIPGLYSATSSGQVTGHIGGVKVDKAGGRRLESPTFHDLTGGGDESAHMGEVWWEESVGTIRQMSQTRLYEQSDGRFGRNEIESRQPESLIVKGGPKPGAGTLFIYQFETVEEPIPGNFGQGDIITYTYQPRPAASATDNAWLEYARQSRVPVTAYTTYYYGFLTRWSYAGRTTNLPPWSGGSRVIDSVSSAKGYYNPIILKIDSIVNPPGAWVIGDRLDCASAPAYGQALGRYGGQFTFGGYTYFVVYDSNDDWAVDTAVTAYHERVWRGVLTSADHLGPDFSASIVEVYHLNSVVHEGGSLRPVMAVSYRGFNPNDQFQEKPVVTSFGDFHVLEGGDYVTQDPLPNSPTHWPTTDPTNNYKFMNNVISGVGRAYCIEQLAEQGQHLKNEYGIETAVEFPAENNFLVRSINMGRKGLLCEHVWPGDPFPTRWKLDSAGVLGVYGAGSAIYGCVSFHFAMPDAYTMIEGFGAYVSHAQYDALGVDPAVNQRSPAIVSLHVLGGQEKRGAWAYWATMPGCVHRLEVWKTGATTSLLPAAERYLRIDSAGGGGMNVPVSNHSQFQPTWSVKAGAPAVTWEPFQPLTLHQYNERSVVLYIEDITGTRPTAGEVRIGTIAACARPEARINATAYVEEYGPVVGPNAYRMVMNLGPSTIDTVRPCHPQIWGLVPQHSPADIHQLPWNQFLVGELIRWTNSGGSTGTGRIVHIDRYPHGSNVRVMVWLPLWRDASGGGATEYSSDCCSGAYVRFRCDRINLSQI